MEDLIEWLKRRKPAELVVYGVVALVIIAILIATLVRFFGADSNAKTASMTCSKFTSLSRDEQINTIRQTPGYMDKVPSALSSAAAQIVYNCKAYPADTPISNSNIMY